MTNMHLPLSSFYSIQSYSIPRTRLDEEHTFFLYKLRCEIVIQNYQFSWLPTENSKNSLTQFPNLINKHLFIFPCLSTRPVAKLYLVN